MRNSFSSLFSRLRCTQKTGNTHRLWLISRIFPPSSRNRARKRTSFTKSLKASLKGRLLFLPTQRDTDTLADMMYEEEAIKYRVRVHTSDKSQRERIDSQAFTIKDHSFIRHRVAARGWMSKTSHVVYTTFRNPRKVWYWVPCTYRSHCQK